MVRVAVVVTPKGGRDQVLGMRKGASEELELAVKVAAPPEHGKATKAVCALIASELKLPKSAVTCIRGATSRHKRLEIDADEEQVVSWLSSL